MPSNGGPDMQSRTDEAENLSDDRREVVEHLRVVEVQNDVPEFREFSVTFRIPDAGTSAPMVLLAVDLQRDPITDHEVDAAMPSRNLRSSHDAGQPQTHSHHRLGSRLGNAV